MTLKKFNSFKKIFLTAIFALFLTTALVACKKNPIVNKNFDLVYSEVDLPETTIKDLNLLKTSKLVPNAKLSWRSDTFDVINHEGLLRRPDEDVLVTLELVVSIGTETDFKEFTVKAIGWENQKLDLETFKDPQGFASLGITNRKAQTENVREVNDEIEFLDAFIESKTTKNMIIKINNDLNMGSKYIGRILVERGLWDGVNPRTTKYLDGKDFRENTNKPVNHPKLLKDGVGELIIDNRDGLFIYSETGITINHMTTQIKGNSNNIVFRNLEMRGIWEWDEIDRGDYKALDWDYFTVENAKNIWIDHMTFRTSYDGIMDIKGNVENVTLSWLNLDFIVDDFIQEQFDELEANKNKYPFYRELRETVDKADIMTVAAGQKKAFNWGNTEGGPNFETITVTMHHVYAKNLQDRFPRLRRGDVHVYNTVLDSEELRKLRHIDMKVISQALIPTEQGSILMENSRYVGVNEPIKTHQSSNLDPDFTGKYKVRNSEYIFANEYYYGGSEDSNFDNPWVKSNSNVDYELPFYFTNYEELPYKYDMQDAKMLTKVFDDNPLGAGEIAGFDWLEITNLIDSSKVDRGIRIDEDRIEGLDKHIASYGEKIPIFTPRLYNYYTGKELRIDRDYTYYVDTTSINPNVAGVYEIIYELVLLHNGETVMYKQEYVVYDPDGANEIYDSNIGKPFDNILEGEISVYEGEGDLYLYLSNNLIESASFVISQGNKIRITDPTVYFDSLDVTEFNYIHFVTVNGDKTSLVYVHEIDKETVVIIKTVDDFARMLRDKNTKGKYFKLANDIDFTDQALPYLNADSIFSGIFDGNNFTLSNLNRHAYGGGIWHTITNGMIKNLVLDNITIDIHRTPIYDEDNPDLIIGYHTTSARAGIIVGQVKNGFGYFDNITILNSLVKTENNYGAILIGKIEGYSDVSINNIYVKNSKVDQDGEYAGGLTAGIANSSKARITNVYIDNLEVIERNTKMIGLIIGRAETGVTIENIVIINSLVNTKGSIGGVLGKDDRKGQNIQTVINNIFIDFKVFEQEGLSHQRANIVGNPDFSMNHPGIIFGGAIYGMPFDGGTTGINTPNFVELEEINSAWWTATYSELLATDLWVVKDNMLTLTR